MIHEFKIGDVLGRYRLTRQLALGGMGCVWVAYDEYLDRDIAIKLLPQLKKFDASTEARFYREARAMGRLHDPRVISVFDIGSVKIDGGGETPYIVMELVRGKGLDQVLSDGPLPYSRVLPLMIQVVQALVAAHRAGVIHRDLKPSNIMMTLEGDAKVLDFGLARLAEGESHGAEPTLTSPGMVLGSCPYMAPEQALGQAIDPRADIFSAGTVLYECLSGRRTFTGKTPIEVLDAVVHCRYVPLEECGTDIPEALRNIVEKCLQKDPSRRYSTAESLLRDLKDFQEEEENQPTVKGESAPVEAYLARRRRKRRSIPILVIGVVALGMVFGIFVVSRGREKLRPNPGNWSIGMRWYARDTALRQSTWSPSGKVLLIESHEPEGACLVEIMPEQASRRILVKENSEGMPIRPEFSPDGKAILLNRISSSGSSLEVIPSAGGGMVARLKNAEQPHWLDNQRIIFSRLGKPLQSLWIWNISNGLCDEVRPAGEKLPWWMALPGKEGSFLLRGGSGDARAGLYLASSITAPEKLLKTGGRFIEGVNWYPGTDVLLAGVEGQILGITRKGEFPILAPLSYLAYPNPGPEGRRLAVVRSRITGSLIAVDPENGKAKCLICESRELGWGSRGSDGSLIYRRKGLGGIELMLKISQREARSLGESSRNGSCPVISPDGGMIAFLSPGETGVDLKLVSREGGEAVVLARSVEASEFPSWSPDGLRLAFASGSPLDIRVISTTGGDARPLGIPGGDYPVWNPSLDWIAFSVWTTEEDPRQGTWIVHPDGSGSRKVSPLPTRTAWSSDGSKLFQLRREGGRLRLYSARTGEWIWKAGEFLDIPFPPPHQEFIPLNVDPVTGHLILNISRSHCDLVLFEGLEPERWKGL